MNNIIAIMSDLINFSCRNISGGGGGGGNSSGGGGCSSNSSSSSSSSSIGSSSNITEKSHPFKQFRTQSCHISSTIAGCIQCTVYCQLKYSMKLLKNTCSILKL